MDAATASAEAEDPACPEALSRYRPNVGIVLAKPDGRVWLGRRGDSPSPRNWQFPQGGVDDGESLLAAARRELHEETGASSVALVGRTGEWMAYEFPRTHRRARRMEAWVGQRQIWFAFRFIGDDGEFDLNTHGAPEFDAWRWAQLDEALDLVVEFKLSTYERVIAAFRPLIQTLS
jgi:putative (di)nucleoside polyphosphate hydrolase